MFEIKAGKEMTKSFEKMMASRKVTEVLFFAEEVSNEDADDAVYDLFYAFGYDDKVFNEVLDKLHKKYCVELYDDSTREAALNRMKYIQDATDALMSIPTNKKAVKELLKNNESFKKLYKHYKRNSPASLEMLEKEVSKVAENHPELLFEFGTTTYKVNMEGYDISNLIKFFA